MQHLFNDCDLFCMLFSTTKHLQHVTKIYYCHKQPECATSNSENTNTNGKAINVKPCSRLLSIFFKSGLKLSLLRRYTISSTANLQL